MADVQVGPRGGHFVVSRTGNKRWVGGARAAITAAAKPKGGDMKTWAAGRAKPVAAKTPQAYASSMLKHFNTTNAEKATPPKSADDLAYKAGKMVGAARKKIRTSVADSIGRAGSAAGRAVGSKVNAAVGLVRRVAKKPMEAIRAWAAGRHNIGATAKAAVGDAASSVRRALKSPVDATSAASAISKFHASQGKDLVEGSQKAKQMRQWMKGRKTPQGSFDKLQKSLGAVPPPKVKHPAGTRSDVEGFRKATGKKGLPSKVVNHIAKGRPVNYKGKTYDTPSMKARRTAAKTAGGKGPPRGQKAPPLKRKRRG